MSKSKPENAGSELVAKIVRLEETNAPKIGVFVVYNGSVMSMCAFFEQMIKPDSEGIKRVGSHEQNRKSLNHVFKQINKNVIGKVEKVKILKKDIYDALPKGEIYYSEKSRRYTVICSKCSDADIDVVLENFNLPKNTIKEIIQVKETAYDESL